MNNYGPLSSGPEDLHVAIAGFMEPGPPDVFTTTGPFFQFDFANQVVRVQVGYTSGNDLTNMQAMTWLGRNLEDFLMPEGSTWTWTLPSGDTVNLLTPSSGTANGDPHFTRWGQPHHDSFHGECKFLF